MRIDILCKYFHSRVIDIRHIDNKEPQKKIWFGNFSTIFGGKNGDFL
jgi:hypothetical protein